MLSSLKWRSIGPYRGGRVVAAAGDPSDLMTFYFGACAGGVWKTTDGGTYWENISDGFFQTAAVGAMAVAEGDPNVIYVGTGEACIRGNVSHGDGVYRSTDAGRTWTNIGLRDTRHIARVRVHPQDPDLVYVAALGHAFGPNEQRGVYRSKDGGHNWERVLFRSEDAGAADLSMDPNNPRILYAAIWQVRRTPWGFSSGGPESSLYKSSDGGDTWTDLTDNPGMAKGLKGRIGVSVSPARADRVWAVVEADQEERGLYRSDDGGTTWERTNDDGELVQRPWYYSHVFADPQDPETVYIMNLKAWRSTDGGKTFAQVSTPHGDNHELWIDPRNPRRMIQGNDGGACVSFNGGETWTTIFNQPTGQFYHVVTDTQFPYRVYGTQQDNSAISVPSRSAHGAILWGDCYPVGTSESGHIAVRPDNPNIVYSGAIGSSAGGGDSLLRYDHSTGQTRIVSVWPEFYWGWGVKDQRYRFQWTYPIVISPHDPNILFVAGNIVFRSDNDGASWEAISPDLTRNDVTKMEASGGPIT
ncbi:MAG: glycosyl hydrolase, partial [Chloroflexi bacterium]|nr:glycosyl hydrolase [Chloroflexota bacterium]